VELYKENGIAAIVKIAAHIGFVCDVEFIASENQDGSPGKKSLARKLLNDLRELVIGAEKYDLEVNQEVLVTNPARAKKFQPEVVV
jgi:hypothetical protein